MSTRALHVTEGVPSVRSRASVGAFTLLFGLVMLFIVGFSPVAAVHNAAHDTRHTAAFPCH